MGAIQRLTCCKNNIKLHKYLFYKYGLKLNTYNISLLNILRSTLKKTYPIFVKKLQNNSHSNQFDLTLTDCYKNVSTKY